MTKTEAVKLILAHMADVRSQDHVDDEARQYALGHLFSVIDSILDQSKYANRRKFRKIEAEFIAENN